MGVSRVFSLWPQWLRSDDKSSLIMHGGIMLWLHILWIHSRPSCPSARLLFSISEAVSSSTLNGIWKLYIDILSFSDLGHRLAAHPSRFCQHSCQSGFELFVLTSLPHIHNLHFYGIYIHVQFFTWAVTRLDLIRFLWGDRQTLP